jgi:alpha-D-ribose 1-methylphosphonate 5-triphosphate diphosphatase
MPSPVETVITNAKLVLADEVRLGSVLIRDGMIADISGPTASGEDFEGDYLLPGLVELHTDHLENHYKPRPLVRWNPMAAVQAHDAQVAASGITTVFDALRIGLDEDADVTVQDMRALADAISGGVAGNRLRADHFIHLRCEVSAPDCLVSLASFDNDPQVRLASLMDHAPGQRQFAKMENYKIYYQGKLKMSDEKFALFCERRIRESETYSAKHRAAIAAWSQTRGVVLASHDDATLAHVDDAIEQGIRVAEFPTTAEAARASREAGMAVLMGAPNIVRGSSHSGNVSARDLASEGLLDILSSDYVPFSLMQAVFSLADAVEQVSLPQAVALVSRQPAKAAGLEDRGEIAISKRADLARVLVEDHVPVVRSVMRQGRRVI